jgi:uncharacterized protein (DUF934 family)
MPTHESVLILDGKIAVNTWTHLDDESPAPSSGDISVSIERFRKEASFLIERGGATPSGKLGLRITPAHFADDFSAWLPKLDLVVFALKTFMDGRYFTTARILRERFNYGGEIRVTGAVTPDQMFFMKRCGINAFELAPGHRPEVAIAALSTFSAVYQAAADEPRPVYAR